MDTASILDKLPGFIQKGNKYCKLHIIKQGSHFIIKYSNTKDFFVSGPDVEQVFNTMLEKLKNPPPGKYTINFP